MSTAGLLATWSDLFPFFLARRNSCHPLVLIFIRTAHPSARLLRLMASSIIWPKFRNYRIRDCESHRFRPPEYSWAGQLPWSSVCICPSAIAGGPSGGPCPCSLGTGAGRRPRTSAGTGTSSAGCTKCAPRSGRPSTSSADPFSIFFFKNQQTR